MCPFKIYLLQIHHDSVDCHHYHKKKTRTHFQATDDHQYYKKSHNNEQHKCSYQLISQGKISTLQERLHCNMLLVLDPVIHFRVLTYYNYQMLYDILSYTTLT